MNKKYNNIDVDDRDSVVTLELSRPNQLNAVNGEMHNELATIFREVSMTDAEAIILTGKGEAFCAGGDLKYFSEISNDAEEWRKIIRQGTRIIHDIINLEIPLLARINGDALGLGATLALFCDITIMASEAKIGDTHVAAGVPAGDGGTIIWPLLIGFQKAKEMLMTGKMITGDEAEELGLINYSVPLDDIDNKVDEIVNSFKEGPTVAIQYTKQSLNGWLRFMYNLLLRESLSVEALSAHHPNHKEALDAFNENRDPDFTR